MGISAKIWPAADDEIDACSAEPAKVAAMSNRYSLLSDDAANRYGHAYVHDTNLREPKLETLLDSFVEAGFGVHRIEGVEDSCYVMFAARVRALHAVRSRDPCHLLLTGYPSKAINGVEIPDIVSLAAAWSAGLVLHFFEDW